MDVTNGRQDVMYAAYGLDDNRIDWRIMRYKQQVENQCAGHCYLLELITR
jgi:hypothetical protein